MSSSLVHHRDVLFGPISVDDSASDEYSTTTDSEPQTPDLEPFSPTPTPPRPVQSADWFLSDGNVYLRVNGACDGPDIIYKVHGYFLQRDSIIFRDILCGRRGEDGKSEDAAIFVPDVVEHEMDCLLSFLYHGMYKCTTLVDDWTALLAISSRYMFHEIRLRAISELEAQHARISPVRRIVLAAKHDVHEWPKPAYVELCMRNDPLSPWEAKQLGLYNAVMLAKAREVVLLRRVTILEAALGSGAGCPCGTEVCERARLREAQKRAPEKDDFHQFVTGVVSELFSL
ncbi:predicted protein [Postia placenta Mad-698-R]|uniref:BTB domain-containing protein n=1 Tax=Postia placenta MAD-698-R-SB12 TaxID=670580 RepID=A0A1X6MRA3_9APHY|nr:hypothetical protein POSPLADRAFT_1152083 [Postia placenta MAD-698-R-SB12]EED82149.1 predicted protein [Postia placenta Mad-698-R]OSX58820.1 hypothetical protein POSPLADRAFT_1152083 [Postia placenta MAD-698-R-SB12]